MVLAWVGVMLSSIPVLKMEIVVGVLVFCGRLPLDLTLHVLHRASDHFQAVELMIHRDAVLVLRVILFSHHDEPPIRREDTVPMIIKLMTKALILVVFTENHAVHALRAFAGYADIGLVQLSHGDEGGVVPKSSNK